MSTRKKKHYSDEYPLHAAANKGDLQQVKQLLAASGGNLNAVDPQLNTLLHLAAHKGHTELVNWLCEAKQPSAVHLNALDMYSRSSLYLACAAGQSGVVSILLAQNTSPQHPVVNVDLQDVHGRSPLMACVRKGYMGIIKQLLEGGASVNLQDDHLQTALHLVCSKTKPTTVALAIKCIDLMKSRDLEINLKDVNGDTAVHICARTNTVELLQALLAPPILPKWQPKLENNFKLSALQVATKQRNEEAANILKQKQDEIILKQLKSRLIETWVQADVLDWIEALGFLRYRDNFARNNITGQALQRLTLDSLKSDLNVASLGHREELVKKILEFSLAPQPINVQDGDSVESLLERAKQWEISKTELVLGEVIGKGYFGEVRSASWKGIDVAVKYIYRSMSHDRETQMFYKEISILSKLRHPNIISLLGFVRTEEGGVMMVTELMTGGTLYALIRHNFQMVDRLRPRIITDIVRGMTYLHSRNPPVLHRDLNSKNLLLDDHYSCKLSDFGLSRVKDELNKMTPNVGFLANTAPEVFRGESYSEKADVFSFGMVLYEIFTGREPHEGIDVLKYANKVAHEHYRPPLDSVATPGASAATAQAIPSVPLQWRALITACWDSSPDKRPTFAQIIEQLPSIAAARAPPTSPSAVGPTEDGYIFD